MFERSFTEVPHRVVLKVSSYEFRATFKRFIHGPSEFNGESAGERKWPGSYPRPRAAANSFIGGLYSSLAAYRECASSWLAHARARGVVPFSLWP